MSHDPRRAPTPPTSAFRAVTRRMLRLVANDGHRVAVLWLLFSLFPLAVALVTAYLRIELKMPLLHEIIDDPARLAGYQEGNAVERLLTPLSYLPTIFLVGMFRPLERMDARPGEVSTLQAIGQTFVGMVSAIIPLVAFAILYSLGLMCCILPGLYVLYRFAAVPYLGAAHNYSLGDAFTESKEWSRNHFGLWMPVVLIIFFANILQLGIDFVTMREFVGPNREVGIVQGTLVGWGVWMVLGFFVWLWVSSVFITIARTERLGR